MITRIIQYGRMLTQMRAPLYPEHRHVSRALSRDLRRSICDRTGLASVIADNDRFILVPCDVLKNDVLKNVRVRNGDGGVVERSAFLVCGWTVKICDGPLVDFGGWIDHISDLKQVRIC